MQCPNCLLENPPDMRFCSRCGTWVASAEDPSRQKTDTVSIAPGELAIGSTFAQRYQVIRELGQGGMGRVYKVFDLEIKENVALKLLSPALAADSGTIERFRDEMKLARRVSHRNICRMYDLNREGVTYYITMEYVSGSDLRSVIKKTGDWTLQKSVSIAKQVCAGLAEAHRLGVVHRDLKPHNIMIDEKGEAKVMDFGIARALAAERTTQKGLILGTPHYMSPEQIDGKQPDCRSDVYSLGIILFELMTGKLPFEGDTTLSIAYQHKNALPPHPSAINPFVPEEIAGIILRCLEKDPANRYREAGEVLADLERYERGMEATSSTPPPRPAEPFAVGEEAPETEKRIFVAREAELETLDQFVAETLKGRGKVVFVTGEAGSGKTALVMEFIHRALKAHDDLIVSYGKCSAQTGIGDPYLPFREILSLLTGEVEARWAARAISREHAVRLWNFLPFSISSLIEYGPGLIDTFIPREALAARFAAFTSRSPEWTHRLERLIPAVQAESLSSNLQQQDLFEQYTRVLKVLARERPLALIIDDLQWVDAGSTGLLFHLGRRLEGSRILVIGAYRPAEVALGRDHERHPLESVVNELKRDFGDFEIELDRTDDPHFVPAYLDTEPNELDAKFRETLFRLTRGHPLFTIELLRAMQEKSALVQNETGSWVEGPGLDWDSLPARVEAAIGERISRLPARLQEILTWAAVEGEEFTAETVARLLGIDDLETVKLLSQDLDKRHRLVSAQGVRQLDGRRLSLYRFRHILFQKYLYGRLDPVERAHRHEKVGLALESLYQREAKEVAVQLIRHFQVSGLTKKTVDYLEMAGEQAMRSNASQEAVRYLSGVLEWASRLETRPDAGRRARWERQLGEALLALGQMAESRVHMDRAIALADKPLPGEGARMLAAILGQALVQTVHLVWPRRFVRRSGRSRDSLLESAYVYERLSETFYYTLEKTPAIYCGLRAVNLCERAGLSPGLARNYANLSLAAGLTSLHKLGRRYGRRAMEIAKAVDSISTQGYVFLVLSLYYIGLGNWEKVETLLARAIEIFQKIGDWRRWELCQSTLGTQDFLRGRYADCRMKNEAMYWIADQRGDIQLGYTALVTQALNQLRLGNPDRALGYLASVHLDRLTEENRFEKISALAVLALARLYKGEREGARESAEAALRLFRQPDPRYSIFRGYPCVAEVFLTLWEESGKNDAPEQKQLAHLSHLACRALHRFSKTFPIGRPGDFVWQGLYEWLSGRRRKARKAWERGVEEADKRGLPFEQAQACFEMGRHCAGQERHEYLSRASALFSRLGSAYHLARAEAARKEDKGSAPLANL